MRILHSSDWHLGHNLQNIERTFEHAAFIDWLLEQLTVQAVDVLIIAGDIFDASNPPATALQTWYRFLADAVRVRPGLQMVVVGGNHDSASRLDAPTPLLSALNITIIGGIPRLPDRTPDFARMAVPLKNSAGDITAWCAAMPFIRIADLPVVRGDSEAERVTAGVRQLYQDLFDYINAVRQPHQSVIATGHCYLHGSRTSDDSERKIHMGNLHGLGPGFFPDHLSYVALGHLHRPQKVGGRDWIRYCGSPIPLSTNEWKHGHQVNLVTLDGPKPATIEALPVPRLIELTALPKQNLGDTLAALAALPDLDPDTPEHQRPFLTVHVHLEEPVGDLSRQVLAQLDGKAPRLLKVDVSYGDRGVDLAEAVPVQGLDAIAPEEVFVKCYRQSYDHDPPEPLLGLFHELVEHAVGGPS